MKKRQWFMVAILLFLFSTVHYGYSAETITTVDCDSSTAGVQVVSSLGAGTVVTVPSGAASAIWFAKTQSTCSTALTSAIGYRVTAGNGYDFVSNDDNYTGQLCCIRETGSGTINVTVNKR